MSCFQMAFSPQLADSADLGGKYFRQPFRRYGVVSDICDAQRIPFRTGASYPKLPLIFDLEWLNYDASSSLVVEESNYF
jgi:hypothetical protein